MQRNSGPRLLPLFITFVIVIVVIVAIIAIIRGISNPGESAPEPATDDGRSALLSSEAGSMVRLTTRGPIVADEDFKSYTIEVSPSNREMTVYTGYLDQVTDRSTHANNQQAYEEFVYALDKANIMKGNDPETEEGDDLRGVCATGYIYDYAVVRNDVVVKHLWTSTCDGSKGTLDASVAQLNNLFFAQIPDSNELIPFKSNPLRLGF